MSGAVAGGAAAAAIGAAKRKAEMDEEEEKLTKYNSNDMDNWEFKIMRSDMGRFSNPDYLRKVIEEEARAGWEMVEKFDDNRVRFKRRIEKRTNDQFLAIDPYRTSAGFGGKSQTIMVAILLALGMLVALGVLLFNNGMIESGRPAPYIIITAITLIGLAVAVIAIKRRK